LKMTHPFAQRRRTDDTSFENLHVRTPLVIFQYFIEPEAISGTFASRYRRARIPENTAAAACAGI